MTEEEKALQRFYALSLRRDQATPEENLRLAPKEHGAWAEYRTLQHPIYGPIEQLGAIPAYAIVKALGGMTDENTTPPSLEQMAEGYRGVGRGVKANLRNLFNRGD